MKIRNIAGYAIGAVALLAFTVVCLIGQWIVGVWLMLLS
jgi:hypothetical protein